MTVADGSHTPGGRCLLTLLRELSDVGVMLCGSSHLSSCRPSAVSVLR